MKEKLLLDLCSNIIYKYTCDKWQVSYIGSSIKQSRISLLKDLGYSCRTESLLAIPVKSSIREHHYDKFSTFFVATSTKDKYVSELRILKSMYIKKLKSNFE